jgi:hypothetical protein
MHYSSDRPRSARTPQAVGKAKRFLKSKAKKSIRKLARKLTVSRSSASRILHNDLRSKAYKVVREPKLTERQMRNLQNERVWAVSRVEADKNGGIHRANKFPEKNHGFSGGVLQRRFISGDV